jgi:hypothetical protein
VAGSKAEAFLVELHSDVAATLAGPDDQRLRELEKETGKRFAFKTKKSFRLDRFAVLAEGKASEIDGLPARDEPARKKSSKPAPEAVVALDETLLEGAEIAEEAAADGAEPPEKPKKKKTRRGSRGGRGRRKKTAVVAADGAAPADVEPEPEPVEAVAEASEPSPNGDEPVQEKPKKKTRRGSRGGRRRKKKPAAEASAEPIATTEDAG